MANRNAVLAASRVLAADPVIQSIMTNELDALRARLLAVLPLADDSAREAVSAVLKSRLVFVQVLCVDWLTRETCSRTQLRGICIGALLGALRPLLADDPAPESPPRRPDADAQHSAPDRTRGAGRRPPRRGERADRAGSHGSTGCGIA